MDKQTHGRGLIDGQTDRDRWTARQTGTWMGTDKLTDGDRRTGQIEGLMDGRKDKWADGLTDVGNVRKRVRV